jgi:hypothetical protein
MESLEISFAYPLYNEGSLAIHGSSLDQFLYLGETQVIPLFTGQSEETFSAAQQIGQLCNQILVGLFLLKKGVWGNGDDFNSQETP